MQVLKQVFSGFQPVGSRNLKAPSSQPADTVSSPPSRQVEAVIDELHAIEGPGFEICRPFPTKGIKDFDPWILFDAFGPKMVYPGDKLNKRMSHLGQHPHRGFEAITYFVQGSYDHYDSTGKHGRLGAGCVQLMTAGGGIVHGGAPSPEMTQHGGPLHGYQLWLALPASERMAQARTLDFTAQETPLATSPDGLVSARVLASPTPVYGVTCSVLPTRQPIVLVHYVLQPGGHVSHAVPPAYRVMVHVSVGEGRFGPGLATKAHAEQCVFFATHPTTAGGAKQQGQQQAHAGTSSTSSTSSSSSSSGSSTVEFTCPQDASGPLDVLLLGGLPTGDTIFQYGPFVGGSMADIEAAHEDFRAGRMGGLATDGSAAPRSAWA